MCHRQPVRTHKLSDPPFIKFLTCFYLFPPVGKPFRHTQPLLLYDYTLPLDFFFLFNIPTVSLSPSHNSSLRASFSPVPEPTLVLLHPSILIFEHTPVLEIRMISYLSNTLHRAHVLPDDDLLWACKIFLLFAVFYPVGLPAIGNLSYLLPFLFNFEEPPYACFIFLFPSPTCSPSFFFVNHSVLQIEKAFPKS